MADQGTHDHINLLLDQCGLAPARALAPVAGGGIGDSARVSLTDGQTLFFKHASDVPGDFFTAEAAGLEALRAAAPADQLRIPRVYSAGPEGLLLEWLEPAPRAGDYWERFGAGLAGLHALPQPHFGFPCDNYCGFTPQPNPAMADGYRFFAEARLQHQARLARDRGRLSAGQARQLDRICERLEQWIPRQPPALVHGDLWSGNAHRGPGGEPALIDPAAHYGWAEAELAMTTLFGRFDRDFYQSYLAHSQVEKDWEDRAELYNLYHLLNHLNLFGGAYGSGVTQILEKWA